MKVVPPDHAGDPRRVRRPMRGFPVYIQEKKMTENTRTLDIEAALKKMPGEEIQEFIRKSARELGGRAYDAMLKVFNQYEELKLEAIILRPKEDDKLIQVQCSARNWDVAAALVRIGEKDLKYAAVSRHCTLNEGDDGISVLQSYRTRPNGLRFLETDMGLDDVGISVADCLLAIGQKDVAGDPE